MHDFHHSFTRVLMYGQELRWYVFEALLFCSLDMTIYNAAVSGFITFLVILLLRCIRSHFGVSNLSRKTLVDKHFLI